MRDDLHIDKLFHDKLEHYAEEPPAFVWDNVQAVLKGNRRQRRRLWYRIPAVAALLVLAFIGGWFLNDSEESPSIATENSGISTFGSVEARDEADVSMERDLFSAMVDSPRLNPGAIQASKKTMEKQVHLVRVPGSETSPANDRAKLPAYSLMKSIKISLKQDVASLIADVRREGAATASHLSDNISDAELRMHNEVHRFVPERHESRWKIGVNLSPGYSSYHTSYAANYSRSMIAGGSGGHGSLNSGFAVQYKARRRLRLESGVYYARNGLQTGNAPQMVGKMSDAIYGPASGEELYFNTPVGISGNRMTINGAAGVIEVETVPAGTAFAGNPDSRTSLSSALITPGELTQVFDFVEIPMYLRFMLLESSINLELVGGINAGLIVGNEAFIENEFGAQYIGKTEDISILNMNISLGFGLSYPISKRFSLTVDPRMNYSINSLSRNPDVSFKPYRAGLNTGINYRF